MKVERINHWYSQVNIGGYASFDKPQGLTFALHLYPLGGFEITFSMFKNYWYKRGILINLSFLMFEISNKELGEPELVINEEEVVE